MGQGMQMAFLNKSNKT